MFSLFVVYHIFTFISYFLGTFVIMFFIFFIDLFCSKFSVQVSLNFALLTVLFNNLTRIFFKKHSPSRD